MTDKPKPDCDRCGHYRGYHNGPGTMIEAIAGLPRCTYPAHQDGRPCECRGFVSSAKATGCNTTPCKCAGNDPCGSYRRGEKPQSPYLITTNAGERRLTRLVEDARRSLLPEIGDAFATLVGEVVRLRKLADAAVEFEGQIECLWSADNPCGKCSACVLEPLVAAYRKATR